LSFKIKLEQHKYTFSLIALVILGFIFRMYPHLFLIPRWVAEEAFVFRQTQEMATEKITFNVTIPILTQLIVYFTSLFSHIDLRTIAMSFNPLISALTVVPIYYFSIKYLTKTQSVFVCMFWTFSESVFYRSATYSSTEPLAIFLCVFSLAFYVRKNYIPSFAFLILSLFSHLLPGAFTIGVVAVDMFLNTSKKKKLIAIGLCLAFYLFILSPFDTHIKQQDKINPIYLISRFKISNIMLYSATDIAFGISVFMGSIFLILFSLLEIISTKFSIDKIIISMLIVATGLFTFSWIFYSPYLFAPPRLTIYFIIPLAMLSSKWISSMKGNRKYIIFMFISVIMILSTFSGLNAFLTVSDAPTLNEYSAINDLYKTGVIKDYDKWFADYPATCSIVSAEITDSFLYIKPANQTLVDTQSEELYNMIHTLATNTTAQNIKVPSRYDYIFVSDRMTNLAFFNIYTGSRAYQVHFPFKWEESSSWRLIYNRYGVKVYQRVDS